MNTIRETSATQGAAFWVEVEERLLVGTDLVDVAGEKVAERRHRTAPPSSSRHDLAYPAEIRQT
jgi:hypothetical protein